ncbi:MAG: GxxExxY protein [Anaerolineales bacterium]|nr:GxxExxY protein [Anaerolineales bacterium]
MTELLYKEEVYQIIGAAMEVYNQLGNGFLEGVYQDAMGIELGIRKIPFTEQTPLEITYKGQPLRHHYLPDMVLFNVIILELKVITSLGANEEAQLLNYLKASGLRLGLLINFGSKNKLEWKRLVL